MALETATTISGLNSAWPTGTDPVSQGDNHLRLLKAVLKSQFTGGGTGLTAPVTVTASELNNLSGQSNNIAAQFAFVAGITGALGSTLSAPAGTKMVFYQASAPAGWVKDTTGALNNSMMRVVTSSGGSTGGTYSPIALNWSHTHPTNPHTLTLAQIPAHTHTVGSRSSSSINGGGGLTVQQPDTGTTIATSVAGGNGSHTHGNTGTFSDTWTPKYSNVIICTKS